MKIQDRVKKALVNIMMSPDWGYLGGILKTGALEPDDDVKKIDCDGYNITYNPGWLDSMTDKEIQFVLLHEGLHKAYQHMHMWEGLVKLDEKRANKAMDLIVNNEILASSTHLRPEVPDGYEVDGQYKGMDTPKVFHLLDPEEAQDNPSAPDTHSRGVGMSQEQSNEMDLAIRQAAGMLPANRARELQNALKAKRDWRELLHSEWTTAVPGKDDTSWSRVNPVYLSMGYYLPSTVRLSAKHVNFCIDTSGSISNEVIAMAAEEVAYLATSYPPESLDVIWWDTDAYVQSIDTDKFGTIKEVLKPHGGGGTNPRCLDEYMVQDSVTIILTDGYFGTYTPRDQNTIFLVIPSGTASYIKQGHIIEM